MFGLDGRFALCTAWFPFVRLLFVLVFDEAEVRLFAAVGGRSLCAIGLLALLIVFAEEGRFPFVAFARAATTPDPWKTPGFVLAATFGLP